MTIMTMIIPAHDCPALYHTHFVVIICLIKTSSLHVVAMQTQTHTISARVTNTKRLWVFSNIRKSHRIVTPISSSYHNYMPCLCRMSCTHTHTSFVCF